MARTLYLNDGSTEVVIGDQEEVLGRIIEERLGRDCKELFDDIKDEWIEEPWDTNGKEDYERIADGYYQMLQNALENLDTALKFFSQSRLNRKEFKEQGKANAIIFIDRDLDNKYWSRNSYDLCPECMAQLVSFISEGKEK